MKKILLFTSTILFSQLALAQTDIKDLIPNYQEPTNLSNIDFEPQTKLPNNNTNKTNNTIKESKYTKQSSKYTNNNKKPAEEENKQAKGFENIEPPEVVNPNPTGITIENNNLKNNEQKKQNIRLQKTKLNNRTVINHNISSWNNTTLEAHTNYGKERDSKNYQEFLDQINKKSKK